MSWRRGITLIRNDIDQQATLQLGFENLEKYVSYTFIKTVLGPVVAALPLLVVII